jgi:N-acetylglucosaminyl-diphospho-decaprenol L-rhamnosyltransferase
MADLSAIIVNYNSGWFCANLVDSLLDQAFTTPQGQKGELEIIVIDNDSPDDQHDLLDPLKQRGVKVVYSDDNSGYSGGSNLGMQHVTSDWVLIANPDVVLMPGSLELLLKALYSDPKAGVVGPRGWLDPGFHFLLPPIELLTLKSHLLESAGRVFRSVGRRVSYARSRYAMQYWSGEGARKADVICGYLIVMPTSLARRLGPFDTAFPLYYEDSDLSYRVTKAGYSPVYVKDARAIHFYNKSAGTVFDEVVQKFTWSKKYFFRKHHWWLHHQLYRISTEYLRRNMHRLKGSCFEPFEDLGRLTQAPELDPGTDQPVVVEMTLDPSFVVAVGHLHPGGPYRMPGPTWDALDGTAYFLRVLDPACRKTLAAYKWEKTTPAETPPSYAELKGWAP